MKIVTVLGTRPEIIRLSRIIPLLDDVSDHILIFTGQNFDYRLSGLFFQELGIRPPDHNLETRADSTWGQIGNILSQTDALLARVQPDRFLILGDTNSALSAQCARRRGIPVFHMEAGNRCFDFRVPEENNRRVIDHCSDILMPYTDRSRDNLLNEGFLSRHIYVTGNPIKEVLDYYEPQIESSSVLEQNGLSPDQYFLITLHRAENVDVPERLRNFISAFAKITEKYRLPVVLSLHPRTRSRLPEEAFSKGLHYIDPPGFFDFVCLEKNARAILSDSGTVQEEGCLLRRPTVTLRDVTERPETIECGSNILSGSLPADILRSLDLVLEPNQWTIPPEYLESRVSKIVANIMLGHHNFMGH